MRNDSNKILIDDSSPRPFTGVDKLQQNEWHIKEAYEEDSMTARFVPSENQQSSKKPSTRE